MASVPIGPPLPVSAVAPPASVLQQDPDVALSDDGRYVVSWTQRNTAGVGEVHVQAFDAYHQRVGEELVIASNFGRSIENAQVAIAENGNFAVVYEWQETLDAGDRNIYVRLYEWGEDTFLALERVNTIAGAAGRVNPDVAMADNGSFVVTWQHNAGVDDNDVISDVFFRSFTSDGDPREPADVQVYDSELLDRRQARPSVAIHRDGDRVVFGWEEQKVNIGYAVYDRSSSNAGYQSTRTATIDGSSRLPFDLPVVGIADDKSYVVGYMEREDQQFADNSDDKIETRRFTAAGAVKEDCGSFCRPNDLDFISGIQATNNAQVRVPGKNLSRPAMDVDGDGSLAVAWSGQYTLNFGGATEPWPTDGNDVYFKEFTDRMPNEASINFTAGLQSDSPNVRWGRVHPEVAGSQHSASISKNPNGLIVAYVNGESSSRVMLRRYSDPVDFAGQAFDAARGATDSGEQLKAGESFLARFSVENLHVISPPPIDGFVLRDIAQPPPVETQFFLSTDSDITTSDLRLATRRVSAAEFKSDLIQNLTLPPAGHPIWNGSGTYFIGMIVDSANEFPEVDELNNRNRGDGIDRDGVEISGTIPVPPQFVSSLIADTTTLAPGSTRNFTGFFPPLVSNGIVTFISGTSAGEGLYKFNSGALSVIADTSTPAPGGDGNIRGFSFFGNDIVSSDNNQVAFYASDQSLNPGIYASGTSVTLVANQATDIPGGGGKFANVTNPTVDNNVTVFVGTNSNSQPGLYQKSGTQLTTLIAPQTSVPGSTGSFSEITNPALDEGIIAFRGQSNGGNQEGIYLRDASGLRVVADRNTPVPGRTGNFASFAAPGHVSIEGGDVAFIATDSTFAAGVYLYSGGTLSKIVDTNDAIPNGTGKFTSFFSVSVHDGVVAFHGSGDNGQQGIYVNDHGTLLPVIASGDQLLGRTVDYMQLHEEGMDGNWLAYYVSFTNGEQGIIQGRRLRPAVNMATFRSSGADKITVSYSIVDGPLPGLDIKFYRSPTAAFNTSAVLIDTAAVTNSANLATGNHTLTLNIGAGANQVSLPGAGAANANGDYYIVAAADTSSVPFQGLYHLAGGPVVLHGGAGVDQVKVKTGSVQIEWNGETFTFDETQVTGVNVKTHEGADVIDASDASAIVEGFAGAGDDTLIAGDSTQQLDGGEDDDQYLLGSANTLSLTDTAGQDHLDFSTASAGIALDLDLLGTSQTLAAGLSIKLTGQFEDLTGTPFADTVRVDALSNAPRSIQLGAAAGGAGRNIVHLDVNESTAVLIGQEIHVTGYQPITFTGAQSLVYEALLGWHRPLQREDVTNDGLVVPLDALSIINELNNPQYSDVATGELPLERAAGAQFFDVNNDGFATAQDALVVINFLNSQPAAEGEGESPPLIGRTLVWETAQTGSAESETQESQPVRSASLTSELVRSSDRRYDKSVDHVLAEEWSELFEYWSARRLISRTALAAVRAGPALQPGLAPDG